MDGREERCTAGRGNGAARGMTKEADDKRVTQQGQPAEATGAYHCVVLEDHGAVGREADNAHRLASLPIKSTASS